MHQTDTIYDQELRQNSNRLFPSLCTGMSCVQQPVTSPANFPIPTSAHKAILDLGVLYWLLYTSCQNLSFSRSDKEAYINYKDTKTH